VTGDSGPGKGSVDAGVRRPGRRCVDSDRGRDGSSGKSPGPSRLSAGNLKGTVAVNLRPAGARRAPPSCESAALTELRLAEDHKAIMTR
jgi:hypothetical protein